MYLALIYLLLPEKTPVDQRVYTTCQVHQKENYVIINSLESTPLAQKVLGGALCWCNWV